MMMIIAEASEKVGDIALELNFKILPGDLSRMCAQLSFLTPYLCLGSLLGKYPSSHVQHTLFFWFFPSEKKENVSSLILIRFEM